MISLIIKIDFIFKYFLIKFYNRILEKKIWIFKIGNPILKIQIFFENSIIKFY